MTTNILTRIKPVIMWCSFLGFAYISWNNEKMKFEEQNRTWAIFKFIFWLSSYLAAIYAIMPFADPSKEVYYTKRDVSNYIEYAIVSGITIGLIIFVFNRDQVAKTLVQFINLAVLIDDTLEKLGVALNKGIINITLLILFPFTIMATFCTTSAGLWLFLNTDVRKSLVFKFFVGNFLINIIVTVCFCGAWIMDRYKKINKILEQHVMLKTGSNCFLCLKNKKCDHIGLEYLCSEHLIPIISLLHEAVSQSVQVANENLPTLVLFLLSYFETTGEVLFLVVSLFNLHSTDIPTQCVNWFTIMTLPAIEILCSIVADSIQIEANRTLIIMHRLYVRTTPQLCSPNLKREMFSFSQKIQLNSVKIIMVGEQLGPSFALQTAHSVIVFCSLIITFQYII